MLLDFGLSVCLLLSLFVFPPPPVVLPKSTRTAADLERAGWGPHAWSATRSVQGGAQ